MIELTKEEFYTLCAIIAAVVYLLQWISYKLSMTKAKKQSTPKITRGKKKFIEKKWTPDGYYYDEDKKKWIAPDYPQRGENNDNTNPL